MMRPGRPRSIMPGTNACVPWITPHRLTASTRSQFVGRSEHAAAGLDAGIVHQDVGAAEALAHGRFQPADLVHAADIRLRGHDAGRAARRCGRERLGRAGQPIVAEIGDADPQAETGEAHGRGKADAGRAAGDDGNGVGG